MYRCLLLLCALLFVPLMAADIKHTTDDIGAVKTALASGAAFIVDVREQNEWDDGHIKGAIFMPLSVFNKDGVIPGNIPKDKPVYFHCKAGVRALVAGKKLAAQGYDARPLKAGYDELVKAGLEKAE